MAESATIQTAGLKELRKALKDADPAQRKAIAKALRTTANVVASKAKELAPKKSGALAASIRGGTNAAGAYVQAGGTPKVTYAGPINFGWSRHNIGAQEFMYRAYGSTQDKVIEVFNLELDIALGKVF